MYFIVHSVAQNNQAMKLLQAFLFKKSMQHDKNAARKFSVNICMKFENALEKEALRTKAQQTQIKMNIFVEVIKHV